MKFNFYDQSKILFKFVFAPVIPSVQSYTKGFFVQSFFMPAYYFCLQRNYVNLLQECKIHFCSGKSNLRWCFGLMFLDVLYREEMYSKNIFPSICLDDELERSEISPLLYQCLLHYKYLSNLWLCVCKVSITQSS